MLNNVSKVYAKALFEISAENTSLNLVDDFTNFTLLINSSNDFENLLFFESFSAEEKLKVISDIFKKDSYSNYFQNFIEILVKNKRITYFHQIFKELTVLDDDAKGFLRGVIETSSENVNDGTIQQLKDYIEKKVNKKILFETKVNKKISAGVRAIVGDLSLDATLEHQFELLKNI